MDSIEQLLGIAPVSQVSGEKPIKKDISFSFLFFSDVRKDISDEQKYVFMRDITIFGDREGFEAIYIPERHFYEFGSIYANSALVAAYLIPQTKRIRFRTAGITLPLHHPAEVVEWWAMNDILSGGRVDLGFGSGWNKADFILAPNNYADRRSICGDRISIIQKLWRGEVVEFEGPDGAKIATRVFPKPIQKEITVWLLISQNDEAFSYAGKQGYNIFTMLYGIDLAALAKKITLYRQARKEAGYDEGVVTLMLHTFIYKNYALVQQHVEQPFKNYINSSLQAQTKDVPNKAPFTDAEKNKMLDYAYQRYFKTGGLFGTIDDAKAMIEKVIATGVNEIACLLDFGIDYNVVMDSLPYLKDLTESYRK